MDSGAEGGGGAESSADNPAAEGQGGLQRVFHCHQCSRKTFPNAEHIENFTCSICGSGFVEDITLREDSPSSQSDDTSWGDLGGQIADALNQDGGDMEDIPDFMENMMNPEAGAASGGNGSGRNPHRRRHRHARHVIPIGRTGSGNQLADQFIQTLIANLIGGSTEGGGGPGGVLGGLPPGAIAIATGNGRGGFPGLFQIAAGSGGPGGGVPMMPLYGNPGDYAWGRGGFDAIVTQLLNQMDGTGPPPMSTDDIKLIPTIKVNQTQVEASLQCSVCWDDFKLDEEVRQLRCEHIFHSDCIIPWLELHDTCPVCRKEQGEETEETGTGNAEDNSGSQESDAGSSTGGATSGGVSQQTRSGACPHSSSSASSATAGSGGHTPFTPSGSGGHTPFTQNSQTYQASSNVRNADNLMEAIGRYSSVFNTLLGIPPESAQNNTRTQTSQTSSSSSATAGTAPTATTTASSRSTSTTPSTGGTPAENQQPSSTAPPGGGSSNNSQNQFHDMDLE